MKLSATKGVLNFLNNVVRLEYLPNSNQSFNYYYYHRQTAKFIAETGVSLALDTSTLPPMCGVLTPSTALGTVLLERLRKREVDFYIGEHKKQDPIDKSC